MALWGTLNQANNAPLYPVITGSKQPGLASKVAAMGNTLYGNTTVNAVVNNRVVGVFGVDGPQAANVGVTGTGWVVVRGGTGPVLSLTITANGSAYGNLSSFSLSNGSVTGNGYITTAAGAVATIVVANGGAGFNANVGNVSVKGFANSVNAYTIVAGGTGYANGEVLTVSNGVINATATLTTNTTGGITAVTANVNGAGFSSNTNAVVAIATGAGTTANVTLTINAGSGLTFTVQYGGRANRIHMETLVATAANSMANGGTFAPFFPNL